MRIIFFRPSCYSGCIGINEAHSSEDIIDLKGVPFVPTNMRLNIKQGDDIAVVELGHLGSVMLVTDFCTEYVQRFQGLFNFFIYFSNKCLSNLRGCVFERDIFSKYNCPMYIIHKRTSNTMNHKESLIILMERPAENEFPEIILNLWEYLQSAGVCKNL